MAADDKHRARRPGRRGEPLEAEVKAALGELARAINDGLDSSAAIAESVRRLESMGYHFALYLEATILLTRDEVAVAEPGPRPVRRRRGSGALRLSDKDSHFLKSLKITLNGKPG